MSTKKLSPQAAAKEAQGYQDKPIPQTCANCAYMKMKRALPAWMERDNAIGKKPWAGFDGDSKQDRYTVEIHGVEKDLRCGIGGFAVKKMASCSKFERKEAV